MKSLLLDRSRWDIVLDAKGNIAVADDPYAIAQDVASAARLFLGELYYDTTKGIPYFERILGKRPALGIMKAAYVKAAMSVPGVTAARVFVTASKSRLVTGQIQVTTSAGGTFAVNETLIGR